jgi:nucleotide-binding universal stress UspA family protein
MNLRSLLVVLDGDARCDARVHLAARFGATHASHLLGVAPAGPIELRSGLGAASRHIDDAAAARAESLRRANECVQHFRDCCRAEGVTSVEAGVYEGEKAAVVLHHAHCADLTVIGQADPASPSHREDKRFVEQVLLHNARPTLVVPCAGDFTAVGVNVLVAWDDSRGSARAAADALPLLRQARQVRLQVWCREGEAAEGPIRERLASVRRWLTRQGVNADIRVETTDAPVGDAILATATDLGADLIVMGTYGHSRWTERIVGGATRTALARSAVPLLMSH